MTRRIVLVSFAAPLVLAAACKPDLGSPLSIIEGPRILAVRGVPAEAPEGTPVTYDMLAADANGRIDTTQVTWAVCDKRKPPAEANAVSSACLTIDDQAGPAPTFMAPMPSGACKRFGPQPDVDENKMPIRPRDPDVTGGFYQPVRATLPTVNGPALAFAMERIKCRLANAPSDVAATINGQAPNENPSLTRMTFDPDAAPVDLFVVGQPSPAPNPSISPGSTLTFEVAWSDTSSETFSVWNAATEMIETHRESLSLSWYATAGTFLHDRTGRGEAETELASRNDWKAPPEVGTVHFFLVLRDSRGGVAFAEAALDVGAPQ